MQLRPELKKWTLNPVTSNIQEDFIFVYNENVISVKSAYSTNPLYNRISLKYSTFISIVLF